MSEDAIRRLAEVCARRDIEAGGIEHALAGLELVQAALELRHSLTPEERRALLDELRQLENASTNDRRTEGNA